MPEMYDLLRGGQPPPQYDTVGPTPRNPILGFLADTLRKGQEVGNKVELPLIGKLGDFAVGGPANEVDKWSYGNAPIQINPYAGKTASYMPEIKRGRASDLADTAGAFAGLPSWGKKAVVGAVTGGMAPGPMDAATYLAHTPKKPHPDVGKRYVTEDLGGMVPKTPRKIEDLKDASLLHGPWDRSSRNQKITSVSDEILPEPVITTGGQDFARDKKHVEALIAGASNEGIAKRVQDRANVTAAENLEAGGSGLVYTLPSTMAHGAEAFSSMPSNVLIQLLRNAPLKKADLAELNRMVRDAPFFVKDKGLTRPFGKFAGFENDRLLREQLSQGLGPGATAGELRKAITNQLTKVGPQKTIGYNADDMWQSILDPALRDATYGQVGNTVIRAAPGAPTSPSKLGSRHPDYDTDNPGEYYGSLGFNAPVEVVMPKTYERIFKEMKGKVGDPRQMTIDAMSKRKEGFSEIVDQRVIDSVNEWKRANGIP
jgi:hypothetical protein